MTIEILPAQLANQIAAGEVVERPASVVKELVENSLDAGATAIKIDIEKGGAKRIRISDNGCGIAKQELTLALSRHATSKIKALTDLEGIASLGFRGEALASISSVARLSLTSKPAEQPEAWQAHAEGRDMEVTVQPAAHGNGTTIDVVDLFFNTPARRKFLRTEKTEFSHIEEVVKRIALARFDVAITLTHNHKVIKQYRLADTDTKRSKRVAQVCGQAFIDHALEINCQHSGVSLTGWLTKPSFHRNQNDLCYSYVNGRMMRDKLINHAIRQAYQELLPAETYPAFVLFLRLNVREVDVNVHPAKHEVRFHQGRYIHDFIYAACHQALTEQTELIEQPSEAMSSYQNIEQPTAIREAAEKSQDYIAPLRSSGSISSHRATSQKPFSSQVPLNAAENYQQLMTPVTEQPQQLLEATTKNWLFVAPHYGLFVDDQQQVQFCCLKQLAKKILQEKVSSQWPKGITSQPLLLPVKVNADETHRSIVNNHQEKLEQLGIVVELIGDKAVKIRQFPAMLRHVDVSYCYLALIETLSASELDLTSEIFWQQAFAEVAIPSSFQAADINKLLQEFEHYFPEKNKQQQVLKTLPIDLTSAIQQLQQAN
ncbi:DNA mismatch repair endonuclease MutL [Thalassotalea sp. 1_MG-2023]|uniref:DNA mismatch repair endonuclease MutL n=1 Tax=Thalassotalea sp. 1_MG-2023 TaxID=3062680 RepID=UPI0026E3DDC6|nr:DNA mismatch repair endonuclease MutL [Thalassotalea sp. 1_MG-2023]MDO6425624.1 DNA mismatch repair endonuclease MutL [Thalassotalea sp. 1_MG-2023]